MLTMLAKAPGFLTSGLNRGEAVSQGCIGVGQGSRVVRGAECCEVGVHRGEAVAQGCRGVRLWTRGIQG